MTNKLTILIIGGLIALIVVLLAVVVVTYKSPKTESGIKKENGVMSKQEAERRVEELKEKIKVPIDEETREKIDGLVNDLARDHEYTVEVNGRKYSVAWKARGDLLRIGVAALPQLIDAATAHNNPSVRQDAVGTIYLGIKHAGDDKVLEYLPVFVRSTYDEDVEVRGTATAQIANMARRFHSRKRQKELDQVIPYLVKALSDKEGRTQALVGDTLFWIGRKDLVPEELIKKHKLGKIIITYGPS